MTSSKHTKRDGGAAQPDASDTATQLIAAPRSQRALDGFPAPIPETLDAAYAIQDAVLARDPAAVAGWKVGVVPESFRPQFGDRVVGPVMAGTVRVAGRDGRIAIAWKSGWFQGVEAEFVFRLSRDLPPRDEPYVAAEIFQAVDAAHAGVELLASPIADIVSLGPGAIVGDYGLNAGLVLGPEIADWAARSAESLGVQIAIGNAPPAVGSAASIIGGLTEALVFAVNELNRRGHGARLGEWICTGATTGLHPLDAPCAIRVDFAGLGTVTLEAKEAPP